MHVKHQDFMGDDWYKFHKRVFDVPGPLLDIGCAGWDWSSQFAGKKKVVGYDPLETNEPAWASLRPVGVTPLTCRSVIYRNGLASSRFISTEDTAEIECVSFESVLSEHKPSLVKMNIEGDEYGLLSSVQHPVADQLIVAFHDGGPWKNLYLHYVNWLAQWYQPVQTDYYWNWWAFLANH